MKGLMVSLIIVIFAGVASSVSAAGQQSGEGAAGFKPRLQPISAFERPGPDDSEDEEAWPKRTSLTSRDSTNTSNSFGGQQFASQQFGGSPAPESAEDGGIRFDVKVNDDAISKLRRGLTVYSPVDVRDENSHAPLPASVVSRIAFFHDANARKSGMQPVRLEPAPMEPGSKTLTFEIHENQLDRIESDAFLFEVPDQLRGAFDRVEFVAVAGPTGSHNFSKGVTSGTRGTGFGLASPGGTDRFESTSDPSEFARQWGNDSPQPGPSYEPGDSRFIGPAIEPSELEARRNRVAPLGQTRGFAGGGDFPQRPNSGDFLQRPSRGGSALNTNDRFQVARRETAVEPKTSPFGEPWARDTSNQRSQQALAGQQQVRALQEQLAAERAEKEQLTRNAIEWKDEASRLAQERNDYSNRLREERGRQAVPTAARQVNYQEGPGAGRSFWDRGVDAAGNLVRPFGNQRVDFQSQGNSTVRGDGFTPTELDLRRKLAQAQELAREEADEIGVLQARLASVPERGGPAGDRIVETQYSRTDFNLDDRRNRGGGVPEYSRDARGQQQVDRSATARAGELSERSPDKMPEKNRVRKSGASDLLWLLPLLFGSLGLNVFLWLHWRTLDYKYNDLADELRRMVGASTIV